MTCEAKEVGEVRAKFPADRFEVHFVVSPKLTTEEEGNDSDEEEDGDDEDEEDDE